MKSYSTLAAVDLGSNSFRLQVARVEGAQIYPLDSLKETVRLGAGLGQDKYLDQATIDRALACLQRFGERLRGLPAHAVRAVGTNTFRVARNAHEFLTQAEVALGFPIEIIAGREEARLIYLGVSHGLPELNDKRLVVDIGGGSTEFIIGTGYEPGQMESLYMGCVSYSQRYFTGGKVSKDNFREAQLAARAEMQSLQAEFAAGHWRQAVGSSGTAKALSEIMKLNGLSDGRITSSGLAKLCEMLLNAGDSSKLLLHGLKPDRIPVLPGGLAIMSAIFDALNIDSMQVSESALREGVLHDLLGRFQSDDMRETTVMQFMNRYHVDQQQAKRVESCALDIFRQLADGHVKDMEAAMQRLSWVARLHEIGLSIAHTGYHKHSAYILEFADMPGFSRKEQEHFSRLARAQRGSLQKAVNFLAETEMLMQILALRLAVMFYRSRIDIDLPQTWFVREGQDLELHIGTAWLEQNPLTVKALEKEMKDWKGVGLRMEVHNS